jgi:hypothetical protein
MDENFASDVFLGYQYGLISPTGVLDAFVSCAYCQVSQLAGLARRSLKRNQLADGENLSAHCVRKKKPKRKRK